MENTITFNNADELVSYCKENNIQVGQVWVESNPDGHGVETLLYFSINDNTIDTGVCGQDDIEGVDYAWESAWYEYTGTFVLVLPYNQHTKPKLYEEGDFVEILDSARECGDYDDWLEGYKQKVGQIGEIECITDMSHGINYVISFDDDKYMFPHYCVRKIESRKMTLEEIQKELGYKIEIIN